MGKVRKVTTCSLPVFESIRNVDSCYSGLQKYVYVAGMSNITIKGHSDNLALTSLSSCGKKNGEQRLRPEYFTILSIRTKRQTKEEKEVL